MDCEIEVEVRISHIRAALYGLVFRFLEDNGYYFVIDPVGGYALGKIEAGEWTRITYYFAQSDAIHEGQQTNRLRLRVDGSQISLYANDELLETVNDTMFDGGQIGLMVKHDDYQDQSGVVEVHFDNFEVRHLSEDIALTSTPTPTPTPSIDRESTVEDKCQHMYVVGSDTLYSVARRYGVYPEDIVVANGPQSGYDLMIPGNVLCIPFATSFADALKVDPTPIPGSGCRFMHVVREGDDFFGITMRYGVSQEDILNASGLENRYPSAGTILCIP